MKRVYKNYEFKPEGEYRSEDILEMIEDWASTRTQRFKKFEYGNLYLEKHSVQSLIDDYIKWFNRSVDDCGDGYDQWDSDDMMHILYNNGHIETIGYGWHDEDKKIKTDGINSIILSGGWGVAFAGPCITFEDATVYDDIIDIRVDFNI